MRELSAGRSIAILAGGGALPPLVAAAAADQGYVPIVFAVAGEADPAGFGSASVHIIRWGDLGRLLRLAEEAECREAVFVGAIARRPDFRDVRPDLGTLKLLPRILRLLRGGDDRVLRGVAAILAERGVNLVGPLDVAPQLALGEGFQTRPASRDALEDVEKAAEAARLIGRLDIGQAAVAIGGRVVAVEDAGGTDALLERVAALRRSGRIGKSGGVLVKCLKPQQDRRLDLPAIGPETAEKAREAALEGVAAEAGLALLVGHAETIEAFRRAGVFLFGLKASEPAAND